MYTLFYSCSKWHSVVTILMVLLKTLFPFIRLSLTHLVHHRGLLNQNNSYISACLTISLYPALWRFDSLLLDLTVWNKNIILIIFSIHILTEYSLINCTFWWYLYKYSIGPRQCYLPSWLVVSMVWYYRFSCVSILCFTNIVYAIFQLNTIKHFNPLYNI